MTQTPGNGEIQLTEDDGVTTSRFERNFDVFTPTGAAKDVSSSVRGDLIMTWFCPNR
ncbi:MAG: hypothetical protein IID30_03810 [Planctomycetes bacterium]|nr:hypothetical protein [Planctomycetota bacterium]